MTILALDTLRRIQRRLENEFTNLVDWHAFSLEVVRSAVAARMGGDIELKPFHWEARAYFGLTIGYRSPGGPRWLVVYEQDAVDEHHLTIVLHEFVHIALGHCAARLTSDELRQELLRLGLISQPGEIIAYARACVPPSDHDMASDGDREEAEAELGAAWILTQARRAGALPPSGRTFSPEHVAISRLLSDTDSK